MTLLPTFIVEWKDNVQLDVSENKVAIFSPANSRTHWNLSVDPRLRTAALTTDQ